jgi:serine/threonine protein kinase
MLHGKYVVGRVLGRPGGFGITYLGFDTSLDTVVAIKEYHPRDIASRSSDGSSIRPMLPADGEIYQRGLEQFVEEARTLARFRHPNIVGVHDVFREWNTAFMVMDYHLGANLADHVIRRGGALDVDEAIDIFLAVLAGLKEVHGAGLLHRDIKPLNVYVTDKGRTLLLDFGAARSVQLFDGRTVSMVYAPDFAAPEQQFQNAALGPATDIHGAGAMLFHMLTGKLLPPAISRLNRSGEDVMHDYQGLLPEGIASVIAGCIDSDPARRYQMTDEVVGAILAAYTRQSTATTVPAPQATTNQPSSPTIIQAASMTGRGPAVLLTSCGQSTSKPVDRGAKQSAAEVEPRKRRDALTITAIGLTCLAVVLIGIQFAINGPDADNELPGLVTITSSQPARAMPDVEDPVTEPDQSRSETEEMEPTNRDRARRQPTNVRSSDAFPYSRDRFISIVMDNDLKFDNNDFEESRRGIVSILLMDEGIRSRKYAEWRRIIPSLRSFDDGELDQALRGLFDL